MGAITASISYVGHGGWWYRMGMFWRNAASVLGRELSMRSTESNLCGTCGGSGWSAWRPFLPDGVTRTFVWVACADCNDDERKQEKPELCEGCGETERFCRCERNVRWHENSG